MKKWLEVIQPYWDSFWGILFLPLMTLGQLAEAFFNKHKGARRFGLFMVWVFNFTILYWVLSVDTISDNHRFILVTILGLNQVYIGLYQWDRMQNR